MVVVVVGGHCPVCPPWVRSVCACVCVCEDRGRGWGVDYVPERQ